MKDLDPCPRCRFPLASQRGPWRVLEHAGETLALCSTCYGWAIRVAGGYRATVEEVMERVRRERLLGELLISVREFDSVGLAR